jgi:hypothetical protein
VSFGQAEMSRRQADLPFGQADMSFGQADMSRRQADLPFGQADMSFGQVDVSLRRADTTQGRVLGTNPRRSMLEIIEIIAFRRS